MKKNKKNRSNYIRIILIAVVIAVCARAFTVFFDVLSCGVKDDGVSITISESDATAYKVGKILKKDGIIKSPAAFCIISTLKGTNDDFYAGTFTIDKNKTSYSALINTFTYVSGYKTCDITITEGMTTDDIKKIASGTGFVSEEEFENALSDDYDCKFIDGIKRENRLEGYLFPDTYNISNTMSAHDIIQKMLDRFSDIFTQKYELQAKNLGRSTDEIIILASMVEAEAAHPEDRPKVASVFYNRLNNQSEFPYLQSCATVQYILGDRKAILSTADTQIDSPYNTYRYKGLPKGPIGNPGKAAIEAALCPADTNYYYFQSDSDGNIYYAETFEQHEKMRLEIQ